MVGNRTSASVQPLIPIFKDENYQHWSLEMKIMFQAQELWELIGNGFTDMEDETSIDQKIHDLRKKDTEALFMI